MPVKDSAPSKGSVSKGVTKEYPKTVGH
jgi:hypothetical protein